MNKQEKEWILSKISCLEAIAYTMRNINPNINYGSEAWYIENFVKEIKEKTK